MRKRNLDELLTELDNIIDCILDAWRRKQWESRVPIIISLIILVVAFIVVITMVILAL